MTDTMHSYTYTSSAVRRHKLIWMSGTVDNNKPSLSSLGQNVAHEFPACWPDTWGMPKGHDRYQSDL